MDGRIRLIMLDRIGYRPPRASWPLRPAPPPPHQYSPSTSNQGSMGSKVSPLSLLTPNDHERRRTASFSSSLLNLIINQRHLNLTTASTDPSDSDRYRQDPTQCYLRYISRENTLILPIASLSLSTHYSLLSPLTTHYSLNTQS